MWVDMVDIFCNSNGNGIKIKPVHYQQVPLICVRAVSLDANFKGVIQYFTCPVLELCQLFSSKPYTVFIHSTILDTMICFNAHRG
jgi:hypothetical protein